MSYTGLPDDFKKRRMIAKGCVRTHFAEPWQFRVEVDGEDDKARTMFKKDAAHHSLFDYLAKNVSFGPTEIATEPVEAGANVFTFPKTKPSISRLRRISITSTTLNKATQTKGQTTPQL
jgi:hypothetical protein